MRMIYDTETPPCEEEGPLRCGHALPRLVNGPNVSILEDPSADTRQLACTVAPVLFWDNSACSSPWYPQSEEQMRSQTSLAPREAANLDTLWFRPTGQPLGLAGPFLRAHRGLLGRSGRATPVGGASCRGRLGGCRLGCGSWVWAFVARRAGAARFASPDRSQPALEGPFPGQTSWR